MCPKCGALTVAPVCDKCRKSASEDSIDQRRGKGICPICNVSPKATNSRYCYKCGLLVSENRKAGRAGRPEWRDAHRIIHWRSKIPRIH